MMMNTVHFIKTREYLNQVREAAQKVEMLKKRIEFREDAGMDVSDLPAELEIAMQDHKLKVADLADMISRVPKVKYQWILMKRYVELLDWDEIARQCNMSHKKAVSAHGLALPEMPDVLVDVGIVAPEDAEDISVLLPEEGTLDTGTMEDYLKYREEKRRDEV